MKTLSFQIPEYLDIDHNEVTMIIASKLYEKGKLSLGQAAEIAGLSKRAFAEMLGKHGVSIFNYSPTDLSKDLRHD